MLRLLRSDCATVVIGALTDQVYSYEDETGRQYHWSVNAALTFAQAKNEVYTISLSEMGVTLPLVRQQYQGLDERHALTCDLSQPLLFVPLGEKVRLIDGWHRTLKALLLCVDVLPACFLTQEEADACLLWSAEPGQGIDWEQNDAEAQGATGLGASRVPAAPKGGSEMAAFPHEPHTSPAAPIALPSAARELAPEAPISAEEEAFLCARYEEEKRLQENAETLWGSDWPDGPLCVGGCGW